MKTRMKRMGIALVGSLVAAVSMVAISGATATYDFASVSTSLTSEIDNAFTVALPIGGALVGLFVGWRLFKRLSHG